MIDACTAFSCKPWIAVYAECNLKADLFLTSLENYDRKYYIPKKAIESWKMGEKAKRLYSKDKKVKHIHIEFEHKWDD